MRNLKSFTLSIAAALAVVSLPSLASAGQYVTQGHAYSVELNKTEILRLPAAASAVVIGNPSIADVSVHAADTLFVVGRGYGETNLIVLDQQGRTLMDADIQVSQSPTSKSVRVFNRSSRQSFNCAPKCQPAPVLGDSPDFIGDFTSTERAIVSSQALGAQSGGAPSFGGEGVSSSSPQISPEPIMGGPNTGFEGQTSGRSDF
ncbi:pilus assembly protein N-terminal domain-containing protein [Litorimonas haliclonae]|uniref:pilus assembly protein N-terminal domain-containing protein n=1 Tax=Litorimonas haliclonae TaxID=2081977 RepID=UPI0039F14D73